MESFVSQNLLNVVFRTVRIVIVTSSAVNNFRWFI